MIDADSPYEHEAARLVRASTKRGRRLSGAAGDPYASLPNLFGGRELTNGSAQDGRSSGPEDSDLVAYRYYHIECRIERHPGCAGQHACDCPDAARCERRSAAGTTHRTP